MDNITEIDIEGYKIIEYKEKNIYIIENIFDNELCDKIINIIDIVKLKKTLYGPGENVKCYMTEIHSLLEENDELYYSFSTDEADYSNILKKINNKEYLYTNNLNGLEKDVVKELLNKINTKIEIIKNIFKKINNKITFDYNSGFLLRKIYGSTRCHSDGPESGMNRKTSLKYISDRNIDKLNDNFIRISSCIFALNDEYSGGVLNFPYHNVNVKLKKGSLICFPPYWTHPHEVSEATDNKYRYTLSTWFCEKY